MTIVMKTPKLLSAAQKPENNEVASEKSLDSNSLMSDETQNEISTSKSNSEVPESASLLNETGLTESSANSTSQKPHCSNSSHGSEGIKKKREFVRRPIIIDGCNVIAKVSRACYNVHSSKEKPNALTLLMMVHDLIDYKYEVFVTIKEFFMDKMRTDYYFVLEELQRLQMLYVLPDRVDDDLVILNTAHAYSGSIISNDQFRDKGNEYNMEKEHRIDFNFETVPWNGEQELAKAKYKFGIRFNYGDFKARSLCFSTMPEYPKVKRIYETIAPTYFTSVRESLDIMASYVQMEQCYSFNVPLPIPHYLEGNDVPEFQEYQQKRAGYEARRKFLTK
ncbi:unnamed protein product [Bursaphelenchus okinawaensis]|uniref:RNase NYN domain-containing protein n=1 Tax=Bursaphelenchus okinawaensis TaxID=465554 RepID=A0A811JPZ2_9BILA|nr:unnamed protein product [Bursaphelenchus okinawaensis]CAG9077304.1 unnamed protein product [Bursaphelenchus okinawaensis]